MAGRKVQAFNSQRNKGGEEGENGGVVERGGKYTNIGETNFKE